MALALDSAAQDLLFRQAQTANTFTDEPVTDEQMQAVYDLVKFGPTAFNQSPLRVTLVRSEDARKRLVKHAAGSNADKTLSAPLTAVLSFDVDFHERLPELFPAAPGIKDTFFAELPAREAAGAQNATLQAGYFIVGVRAAGLAAGPMTGFDFDGINAEFFEDGKQRAFMVVNIGKPGEDAFRPRAPRLSFDDAVTTV
ncbi:malonic semialdehyde reductase [Streptomyces sp. ODS28]|uniref:malonic semialdehyde reductase n=1 Tax=Streptomyces sp. ODS28 TaxID=3136688 RepID=UPI0031E51B0F